MTHELLLWAGFFALILGLIAFDLGITKKTPHIITPKEALVRCFIYFMLAMGFGTGVYFMQGHESGVNFFTGYLIEFSLSVDNIFVIVLIFTYFSVPAATQHRVLFWGILGALLMRGALIFVGSELIQAFHWILYLFGVFLIITGIKMFTAAEETPDMESNKIVLFMRKRFRVTDTYRGEQFFVIENGQRLMTPLFIVLVLIECTDLIFALDSIPAIFAITSDPFIVYTSNVFAILGLRSLYFALAGIVHRFAYLKYGLALTLLLIGSKMLLNTYFDEKIIHTEVALLITAFLIGGSMIVSLIKTRGQQPEELKGWVPGSSAADNNKD